MISIRTFYSLILVAFISSCGMQDGKIKLAFTGAPSEVVCEVPTYLWENGADSAFQKVFYAHYPALPQPEYMFNILHYSPKDINQLLRCHRNFVKLTIDTSLAAGQIKKIPEKFSRDQIYFEISVPNYDAMASYLKEALPYISEQIQEKERSRFVQTHRGKNPLLTNKVKEKFNIQINAPVGFKLAKEKNHFLWFNRERIRTLSGTGHDITDGLIIFETPYNDSSSVAEEAIYANLNQYLAEVPGPVENSHMTLEMDYYLEGKNINFSQNFARECRGLWKLEGAFMGGSFISLSLPHYQKGRIIHVLGFVYAPKFNKREFVKELESMVYSVQF